MSVSFIKLLLAITMSTSQYRLLLIASLVFGIISAAIDPLFPTLIPESMHQAQEAYEASLSVLGALSFLSITILGFVLFVVSFYGLYRFRSWAPRLAVIGTAVLLLAVSFSGPLAQSGLAIAFSYLSSYLWGAAIFLAYVHPMRSHFRSNG